MEDVHGELAGSQMGQPAENMRGDSPQQLGSPGMGDEDEFPIAGFSDDDGGASPVLCITLLWY